MWDKFFAEHKENPTALRAAVEALFRAKKYDHVVEFIKAALSHGQSSGWMYEALALAQVASGAEKDEIRRTLLSAADVSHESPDAQYRVARLLARYELKESAIRLFRAAAEQSPLQPEPYAEAIVLAVEVNDVESTGWAATRLLSQGWVESDDELHRLARVQVAELERKLRGMGRGRDADQLASAVRVADSRDLVIHATWEGDADIDLVVVEPLGTHCSVHNRRTPAGGVLVRDGYGKRAEELYVCSRALPGPYEVRAQRVWGTPEGRKVRLEVIRGAGTENEKRSTHYLPVESDKPLLVQLDEGRRRDLLAIPQVAPTPLSSTETQLPIQKLKALAERMDKRFQGATHLFQFGRGGGSVAFDPMVEDFFEGAGLGVQAIVSADRRYVRLQMQPFFNDIVGERRFPITAVAQPIGGGR